MEKIRNCAVCDKEIRVIKERMGTRAYSKHPNSHNHNSHSSTFSSSQDGVTSLSKWFCNDCWKKIIDYAKNVAKVI
jgi:hypothetical protein